MTRRFSFVLALATACAACLASEPAAFEQVRAADRLPGLGSTVALDPDIPPDCPQIAVHATGAEAPLR
jgi:hypothetical protein